MNLYQHTKNQAISLICSGHGWSKTPANRMAENISAHISGKKFFSQIWDLCKNIANNIYYPYRTYSVKNTDQIFNKLKKPCFGAHLVLFLIFGRAGGEKKIFPENLALLCTMPKFRKNRWYNSKKCQCASGYHTIIPSFVHSFCHAIVQYFRQSCKDLLTHFMPLAFL